MILYSAVAAFSLGKLYNGTLKLLFAVIRPEAIGEIKLFRRPMHPSISLTPIIAMRQIRMGNAIVSEKIHATTSRAIPTARGPRYFQENSLSLRTYKNSFDFIVLFFHSV